MKLEEQITRGRVACIRSVDYDPQARQLVVHFEDCLSSKPSSVLSFSGVKEYSNVWHDPEDQVRSVRGEDSLIGLDEYPGTQGVRYVIETECHEIIFVTQQAPELITMGKMR